MKKRLGLLLLLVTPLIVYSGKKRKKKSPLVRYALKVNLLATGSEFEKNLREKEELLQKNDPEKYARLIGLAYTKLEDLPIDDTARIRQLLDDTIEMQEELRRLAGMES